MKNDKKYYAAIDLGATSGRVVLATNDGEKIDLEVVHRFPNRLMHVQSHYYWDIYALYENIIEGLKAIGDRGIALESIGVDTWGVDFAFVGADGLLLGMPHSYRDPHTEGAPQEFFKKISSEALYETTGLQVMNFNSIFQLDTLQRNGSSALAASEKLLFIPDVISYLLTGNAVMEYTIASTSGLLNARTRQLDAALLEAVGLDASKFGKLVQPGEEVGVLTAEVQATTGLGAVPVMAVCGHDTASAVAAVPAEGREFAYLSSGTWSLMGIEIDEPIITEATRKINYTNEGGYKGTIRFLKNICGMWLLERCRAEWGNTDYDTLIADAKASDPFRSLIYPDAECFANPASMTKAIVEFCKSTNQPVPETKGQFTRCIFESLAMRYRQVLEDLRALAPFDIKVLHVIGGGARNSLLNQWTADSLGIEVVAGPSECTALGNVMVQAGLTRSELAKSIETQCFQPADTAAWEAAYKNYCMIAK